MSSLLDENGVLYLWNKIKAKFATQASLTSEIKTVKDSISKLGTGDMLKSTYDADGDGVVDNAKKVNGHSVNSDVPNGAKFTDTTYGLASDSSNGLMSKSDFAKLKNLNSNPVDNIAANNGTATPTGGLLAIAGSNGITTDATDDTLTIVGQAATTSSMGMMSANDKKKLNNCLTEAQIKELYALKSDIAGVYKYKGSVASASNLPTSGQTKGDIYNIEAASTYGGAGMNVAWDGSKWDPLGEIFSVSTITNAQIDNICV